MKPDSDFSHKHAEKCAKKNQIVQILISALFKNRYLAARKWQYNVVLAGCNKIVLAQYLKPIYVWK